MNTSQKLLVFLMVLVGVIALFFIISYYYSIVRANYSAKQKKKATTKACRAETRKIRKRNRTDFIWTDMPLIKKNLAIFALFAIFFILFGFISTSSTAQIIGIIGFIITIAFFINYVLFLYNSYMTIEDKAKERLAEFEKSIRAGVEKEISFEGDNIQHFSNEDEEFDTKPQVFTFPTAIKKIPFPPYGANAKKRPIIGERKLEFLILSREYFSICQKASTFNLLNPAQADEKKKCVEKPGACGECDEYYYSQMRNVVYDSKAKGIRIIYNHEQEDTIIPLIKKDAATMKAIKEKLRLTERQKLNKIQEHKSYEDIKVRRQDITSVEIEEDNKESE